MAERDGSREHDAADAHLLERFVCGERVYHGSFLELQRDILRLPDGSTASREYLLHNGAAAVVPLLDDGRLVMVRQHRYALDRVMLEFPAGKIDAGEDPRVCALRELREESGYTAREIAHAGVLHNAAAYSSERIEIFFARGLAAGTQALDEGELIDVVTMTPEQLDAGVARGEITDAKTLIGLLWLQRWRAGAWPLQWQAVGRAAT